MDKIQTLTIKFKDKIIQDEITAFRDSIIGMADSEKSTFLHYLKNSAFLYKYPLIQFKLIDKKPCLISFNYKIDEIRKFFESSFWQNKVVDIDLKKNLLKVEEKQFNCSIINWIALNKENFNKYWSQEGMSEKFVLLEDILESHFRMFFKGIGWEIKESIIINIKQIRQLKNIFIKSKTELCFDVDFSSNVILPDYLGLGKNAGIGFGILHNS
jgi:hypothetical protein